MDHYFQEYELAIQNIKDLKDGESDEESDEEKKKTLS